MLLPVMALAQDKAPRAPQAPPSVRSAVLAYQQLGLSIESLTAFYEARIADLEKRCGDPCKEQ